MVDHKVARLVCRNALRESACQQPASTDIALGVYCSQVPPHRHSLEKLEPGFWKPGWTEKHQEAGAVLPACHKDAKNMSI